MRLVLLYHINKLTVTFKLSWNEKRTKIQSEKGKVSYSTAFLAVGNENRLLEDLPQVDFGHLLELFLLPGRT